MVSFVLNLLISDFSILVVNACLCSWSLFIWSSVFESFFGLGFALKSDFRGWQSLQMSRFASTLFMTAIIFVPTHLRGRNYIRGTIYSNGFFFVQSILADRYIHRREMWVVSLKSCSSVEFKIKKIFWISFFFEQLSRIEILCEHGIFGMNLFTFSVIFLQIKLFSIKIVFQIYVLCHKMDQLCVPNRLKLIKRLVLFS